MALNFILIQSNVSGNISKLKCVRTLTNANIIEKEITQKILKIAVTKILLDKHNSPV